MHFLYKKLQILFILVYCDAKSLFLFLHLTLSSESKLVQNIRKKNINGTKEVYEIVIYNLLSVKLGNSMKS